MRQCARRFNPIPSWVGAAVMMTACGHSADTKAMQDRADRYVGDGKYSAATIVYDSVLAVDPNDAVAFQKAGLLHLELGQLSRAYSRLLAAERLNPNNAAVRLGLGRIALIRGRRDEARQEATALLAAQPENTAALMLFGASAADQADVDEAIHRIEKTNFDPESRAASRLVLASLYQRKHDSSSAARIIRDIAGHDTSWSVRAAVGRLLRSVGRSAPGMPMNEATTAPAAGATDFEKLANVCLLMNRRDWAEATLRQLASTDPSYVPVWRELSELAIADSNFADATKSLDTLLRRDSTDVDARVLRIMVWLARNDTRDALTESNAILTKFPWLTPARMELARAWIQQDSLARAQSELETATREAPNDPAAVLELAGFYIRRGNPGAAVDILNKLIAVDPSNVNAHVLLGFAYRGSGEPRQASAAFREILKLSPKSPQAPYWVGVGLAAEGKYDDAKAQFEEALTRSPAYSDALAQLAQLEFSQHHPDQAVDRVKTQLRIVPNQWQLWNMLGLVSEQAHQDDNARDAYLSAIRLNSKVIEPRSHLASLDLRIGRSDEAISNLRDILEVDPKNLPALSLLGGELDRQGVVAGARDAYERILQIDPRRADAANNLAVLLSRSGQDDARALQLAERARSIDPKNPHIADTLGWLLCRSASADQLNAPQLYARAAGLLAFSASQIPNDPVIQFHLGVASQKAGDLEAARRAFAQALTSTASFPEREEAQRALATLK